LRTTIRDVTQACAIGADTAGNCWLCDRERGELCHVHAPPFADDAEPEGFVVTLREDSDAAQ
jgi:hypothetical protein